MNDTFSKFSVVEELILIDNYFRNRGEEDCVDRMKPLIAAASELVAAAKCLPEETDMIESPPGDGSHFTCCGSTEIRFHPVQIMVHATGCWYVRLKAATAAADVPA